jgi:hypothetical protein
MGIYTTTASVTIVIKTSSTIFADDDKKIEMWCARAYLEGNLYEQTKYSNYMNEAAAIAALKRLIRARKNNQNT